MSWKLIMDVAVPLACALFVLVPKLARSILFESLFHPFRKTELRVRDSGMTMGQS
jgi:hypothetical protein